MSTSQRKSGGPPPRTSIPGEGLRRDDKLLRRADFSECYRRGRRQGGKYFVVYSRANELGRPRLGMTASRKVGKAVKRQRVRRRVREIFRRWPRRRELGARDIVVHVHPAAALASFDELRRELERLLTASMQPRRRGARGSRRSSAHGRSGASPALSGGRR